MLRSPYCGKKALPFGVPRTDCRFSEVEAFDRVGAEGIWSRWSNVSNWLKKTHEGPLRWRERERALRRKSARLKEERDILATTTAWFVMETTKTQ